MAGNTDEKRGALTRGFGSLVTAVVSLIAIGFGYLQFNLEQKRIAANQRVEAQRADRAWKLALTQFGTENYDEIFAADEQKRSRLQALMNATFPSEILRGFYQERINTAKSFDEAVQSSEALAGLGMQEVAARPATETTVYLQYADEKDLGRVRRFLQRLRESGFRTPGAELIADIEFRADVRYFNDGDSQSARIALMAVQELLGDSAPAEPQNLGEAFPTVPDGVIEIWLPKLPD